MNEAQEVILDRLMVVKKIGVQWATGPLGLAIQALQSRSLRGRRDVTRTLGYPLFLCEALRGANGALETVDDRRKLAITFFSEVAPRPKADQLTGQQHVRAALWCAQKAHPLVCQEDCPFAVRLGAIISAYLTGSKVPKNPDGPPICLRAKQCVWGEVSCVLSPEHYAICAFNYAVSAAGWAANKRWPGKYSSWAVRDAAQVAAVVHGVAGAVDFCLALAQQVGLKP
ncbi:MAG TPA: hypothetical protein VEL76_36045 [Gemmataceae bacterium]|nr:hypothetical protein [Gemmataceae bacterium]